MSITGSYYDAARNAQERWVATMEQMMNEWQGVMPNGFTKMDPAELNQQMREGIDRSFDFWTKALEVQRQFAYRVADANIEYLTALQGEASQLGSMMNAQMLNASDKVKSAARMATDAMANAAAKAEQGVRDAAAAAKPAAEGHQPS